MYRYPYVSRLQDRLQSKVIDVDYHLWQSVDINTMVGAIKKPVVEIGGPTQDGFYFIDNVSFNTKPIITNISSRPLPFSPDSSELAKHVVEIFDASKMPYADNSIGIFLMAAMSVSDDSWVELPETEKEKVITHYETKFANALFELGQVAAGVLDPVDVKDAQKIKIYLEVARCLKKDGLFFTDGGIEEIAILQRLGFKLVACLQIVEEYGLSYEFVVAKQF